MASSLEILTAIRELTNTKQLDRTELHGLLRAHRAGHAHLAG